RLSLSFFVSASVGVHLELRSIPTRRSSDLGEHPGLRADLLSGEHPRYRCQQRIPVEQLEVTGELLDSVDFTTPLDFHRHRGTVRSEEHTSELQSRENLVCRLLLEKKKFKPH